MRRLPLIAFLFLAAFAPAAYAGPREEAVKVAEAWGKAFTASDIDGIAKLYAPDALFLGTNGKVILNKPEQIREYFVPGLTTNLPRTAKIDTFETLVVSDTVVVVTGFDTLTGVRDGAPTTAHGRVSFVIAKRGAEWKIVHFHRSPMPN